MVESDLTLLKDIAKYTLTACGGGIVAAFGFVKFFGETWLKNRFSKNLERFKHEQNIEIRKLQFEMDSRLSGNLKIQDLEFQMLPTAWRRLNAAFGVIEWVVSPLQSYPDLDRMNEERLHLVLNKCNFLEIDKNEIIKSNNKLNTFQTIAFRYRSAKARNKLTAFNMFVANNSVLLPNDIKDLFEKFAKILIKAITSKEIGQEESDYKMQGDAWRTLQADAKPLYKEIETVIYNRLRSHSTKPIS